MLTLKPLATVIFCVLGSLYVFLLCSFIYSTTFTTVFDGIATRRGLRAYSSLEEIPSFSQQFSDQSVHVTFTRLPFSLDCPNSVRLLVVVLSAPKNTKMRAAIRETWASGNNSESVKSGAAKVLFLLGSGNEESVAVREEALRYNDIIEIDTPDQYDHLMYKVLSIIHISTEMCAAPFVLKIDEDVVFHIDRFIDHIGPVFDPTATAFYCTTWKNMKPYRNPQHKWYISLKQFDGDRYPTFCSGASYVLTHNAAQALSDHTNTTAFMKVEDVMFTGVVAERANVSRIDLSNMFHRSNRKYCLCPKSRMGKRALIAKHNFKTPSALKSAFEWLRPECPEEE